MPRLLAQPSDPGRDREGPVPQAVAAASWVAATPYPANVGHYAFAQNGEDLYVISGISGPTSNAFRRYNAMTNVWTSLADIPAGSEAPAAAYYGGKIYVADGLNSNAFRIYDIASNTWSLGPPRPGVVDGYGAAAGAFDGRIYIVGGGSAGPTTITSIYTISSNSWSAGPVAPSAVQLAGYTQIGQYLYVIGGFTGSAAANSTVSRRLDMSNNTWSTGPGFTPQRGDFALAAAGLKLYAIGGDTTGVDFFDPTNAVNELDTSTWPAGAWVASPDNLPTARQMNSAGFFSTGRAGGEIWSTGGATGGFINEHIFRPVSVPCLDYNITETTGSVVPASTDITNHCDDCVTAIALPFPIKLYGYSYTSALASSNGNLQLAGSNASRFNSDLPAAGFTATIFPLWDDLRTDVVAGTGIFTSVVGAAPNRVFAVEWRASQFGTGALLNFEIRFLEGSSDFEILYGTSSGTYSGTIGVQRDGTSLFTQFAGPNANPPASGTRLFFSAGCCPPFSFKGSIGSNSPTYPGSSGMQADRIVRTGGRSTCGTDKTYPGTSDVGPRQYDAYTFMNKGPATCVSFSVNTACMNANEIISVAYLGSFNPNNIQANYLGDPGASPLPFTTFSVDVPANGTVVLVVSNINGNGACNSYDVVVSGLSCPLELLSAVSRKTHAAAGDMDVPLPLTGNSGVEPRAGSGRLVFTFETEITAGSAALTSGVGATGVPSLLGTTMTVPLSGVTDVQKITVMLSGLANSLGQVMPNFSVSMRMLIGDATGDGFVNSGDATLTRNRSGQLTIPANFRSDCNIDGTINSGDALITRGRSGQFVPP